MEPPSRLLNKMQTGAMLSYFHTDSCRFVYSRGIANQIRQIRPRRFYAEESRARFKCDARKCKRYYLKHINRRMTDLGIRLINLMVITVERL